MSIWHEKFTLNHVISLRNNNLNKHLGIEFIELGSDYIVARMPVEDHTRQSRGILHGGASCVLAEALGSIASNMCIDMRISAGTSDRALKAAAPRRCVTCSAVCNAVPSAVM